MEDYNNTKVYDSEEFRNLVLGRDKSRRLEIRTAEVHGVDFSGQDLSNVGMELCRFYNCNFNDANLENSSVFRSSFYDCTIKDANFRNANMQEAIMRYIDFGRTDICGADVHRACFEYSQTDDIIYNDDTKWFKMVCPEEGPFIAWKCSVELRVIQLLVPADARRVAATGETCRCDKAKVLSIRSIDETESFTWAQSTVDPDFFYETGKMMYPANGFEPSRWRDSSEGIHFFMERQQAIDYLSK